MVDAISRKSRVTLRVKIMFVAEQAHPHHLDYFHVQIIRFPRVKFIATHCA